MEKVDLSTKTVCIVDNGLGVSTAARYLRNHFGKIYTFVPWIASYPTSVLQYIGKGFDGVERVNHIEDIEHEVDLWIFLDVNFGPLQARLRREGHRVWGSGKGDEIELFRWSMKQYQREAGLPLQGMRLIVGIDALEEFLRAHEGKDFHVKQSETRGDFESHKLQGYRLMQTWLDHRRAELGPIAREYEFIVEDPIPKANEYGYDGPYISPRSDLGSPFGFPGTCCFGWERKDTGYAGLCVPYSKLPPGGRLVNEKIAPLLNQFCYRGFLSTEIREPLEDGSTYKKGDPILIDLTARIPEPPGSLYWHWWKNMPEILWHGAEGHVVDIVPVAPYAFEYILYDEEAREQSVAVEIPKDIEQYVALYNHTFCQGQHWVLPTASKLVQIGGVLGFGDSFAAAEKEARARSEEIKADGAEIMTDTTPELWKTIRQSKEQGIYVGEGPLP